MSALPAEAGQASTRTTLHALRQHRAFAINVLAADQRELSTGFSRRGAGGAAWHQVSHHVGTTGSPRLHGMLASLECTVERRLPGGDHEIVVGRVLDIETSDHDQPPLLFYRGEYAWLPRP